MHYTAFYRATTELYILLSQCSCQASKRNKNGAFNKEVTNRKEEESFCDVVFAQQTRCGLGN